MNSFYKIFILSCFFIFSLLFLTFKGYSYYTPLYQPVYPSYPYQYPPVLPLSYPSSVLPGSYPVVSIYPPSFMGPGEWSSKSTCSDLAVDKDYIYSLIQFEPNPLRGQSYSTGLVIFQSFVEDDYEYISDIRLFEGGPPADGYLPHQIIVQDDLAIIGTMGFDDKMVRVFIVDVSDKENPKMVNSLDLPHHFSDKGTFMFNVSGMAVENNVLYLCISYRYDGTTALYSIDITDPDGIDKNNILDVMAIEYEIYDMVSAPNYLYCAGIEAGTENQEVLIVNTSNPSNILLSGTCNVGGIKEGKTNIVVDGATLFAVVQASGETSLDIFEPNEDSSSVLKIIDVKNPEQPRIVSSSVEVKGRPGTPHWGHGLIVMKDNYAYILSRDGEGSKIHIFNISNLNNPHLIKTEKVAEDAYTAPRYDHDSGMGLYIVDEKLYHHIGEKINIFDISSPSDLSMVANVDLLIRMLAGGYEMPILEGYQPSYPIPPPGVQFYGYGGYGASLYGYGGYRPYPSSYGYGSYLPPIPSPTIMPEPVIHIGTVNIEGGLYIGELHLGSALSSSPYATTSFISPSRGSAFFDFSIPPPLSWYDAYSDNGSKIITKDDDGKTITLQVGDKIEIVLPVINDGEWREKGYGYARDSSVISGVYTPPDMSPDIMEITKISDVSFVQKNFYTEQKEIPVKTYEAKAQGEYELVLEYFSRSNPDEILDTFSLLIKVE
ncbi:MAG: LVIVD repeat-containing protein [bacterium]